MMFFTRKNTHSMVHQGQPMYHRYQRTCECGISTRHENTVRGGRWFGGGRLCG